MYKFAFALCLLLNGLAFGQQATGVTVTFDHGNDGNYKAKRVSLNDGEVFGVVVSNTDTTKFDHAVVGINVIPANPAQAKAAGTKKFTRQYRHDQKYGGYYVTATLKAGTSSDSLEPRTWLIIVDTSGWKLDVGGGFQINQNTNPVFGVRQETLTDNSGTPILDSSGNEQQVMKIYQNEDAEDEAELSFVGSIHVYKDNWKQFAVTFSLGIDSSRTSFAFGPSWKMGDKSAISLQGVYSQIDRLPGQYNVGDVVTDANILSNLPTKSEFGAALTFTYSFIKIGDLFQKPFPTNN